jgi:hypothetical protein
MKKLAIVLTMIFVSISNPVHASTPKTLAIIDTGVDIAHPAIKNNIIHEVCVSGYTSCPNKQNFMDGPGSATVTPAMYSNSAWGHGTEVASAAVQTDPNVQIIEIRCASLLGANGYIGCNNDMLAVALNWVYTNAAKYNIGAVVTPMGGTGACNTSASYVAPINKLVSTGMAVIFPTGNDFNYTSVDNPACLPGVLAISAIDNVGRLALYANYSSRVDFASNGNLTVASPGNQYKSDYGTSLSVATFGAGWLEILNLKGLSYNDEYNLIKSTGTNYTNIMVKKNVLAINIAKAVQ